MAPRNTTFFSKQDNKGLLSGFQESAKGGKTLHVYMADIIIYKTLPLTVHFMQTSRSHRTCKRCPPLKKLIQLLRHYLTGKGELETEKKKTKKNFSMNLQISPGNVQKCNFDGRPWMSLTPFLPANIITGGGGTLRKSQNAQQTEKRYIPSILTHQYLAMNTTLFC